MDWCLTEPTSAVWSKRFIEGTHPFSDESAANQRAMIRALDAAFPTIGKARAAARTKALAWHDVAQNAISGWQGVDPALSSSGLVEVRVDELGRKVFRKKQSLREAKVRVALSAHGLGPRVISVEPVKDDYDDEQKYYVTTEDCSELPGYVRIISCCVRGRELTDDQFEVYWFKAREDFFAQVDAKAHVRWLGDLHDKNLYAYLKKEKADELDKKSRAVLAPGDFKFMWIDVELPEVAVMMHSEQTKEQKATVDKLKIKVDDGNYVLQ